MGLLGYGPGMVAIVVVLVLCLVAVLLGCDRILRQTVRTVREVEREGRETLTRATAALSEELRRANDRADRQLDAAHAQSMEQSRILGHTIRESVEGIVEVIGKNAAGPIPEGPSEVEDSTVPNSWASLDGEGRDWTEAYIGPMDREGAVSIPPGGGIPGIVLPDLTGERA